MGRIVQEQGRRQLGLGFGEAKCASCNGFSIEQLSLLRFDHMNLREVFEELTIKNIDAQHTMSRFQKDWHARLPKAPESPHTPESSHVATSSSSGPPQ